MLSVENTKVPAGLAVAVLADTESSSAMPSFCRDKQRGEIIISILVFNKTFLCLQ